MEYTTLSPLAMFMNAGPVGKFVMLTLVLASVYTWVLIVLGVFSVLKIGKATKEELISWNTPHFRHWRCS